MTINLTNADGDLKEHYTDEEVSRIIYNDNPLLTMLDKYEDFRGRNIPIPIVWGDPQARSGLFPTAQASSLTNYSRVTAFTVTRGVDYSLAVIDAQAWEATEGDANAFLEVATLEMDGAISSLARSLAVKCYGDGSGYIAQIANSSIQTTLATNVMQLANPLDIVKFEVQDALVFSATSGSALRNSSVVAYVIGIDTDNNYVYLSSTQGGSATNISTIGNAISNGDFIYHNGDTAVQGASIMTGLAGHIPFTTPGLSDNFFGVNRSIFPARLAGSRLDGTTGGGIQENYYKLIQKVAKVTKGANPKFIFSSVEQFTNLENELGAKRQYVDVKTDAEVAFRGVSINGPKGAVTVMQDLNCPTVYSYALSMDKLKLGSIGKAVSPVDKDGLMVLRSATLDAYEVRYRFYGNLLNFATGFHGVVQLPVTT
jgi:hypothetical protein